MSDREFGQSEQYARDTTNLAHHELHELNTYSTLGHISPKAEDNPAINWMTGQPVTSLSDPPKTVESLGAPIFDVCMLAINQLTNTLSSAASNAFSPPSPINHDYIPTGPTPINLDAADPSMDESVYRDRRPWSSDQEAFRGNDPIEHVVEFATQSLSTISRAIQKDVSESKLGQPTNVHVQKSMNHVLEHAIHTVTYSGLLESMLNTMSTSDGPSDKSGDLVTPEHFGLETEIDLGECEREEFSISYRHDLNIIQLHQRVVRHLQLENGSHLDKLKDKLRIQENLSRFKQTIIDRKRTLQKINESKAEISQIEGSQKLTKYLEASHRILQKYKEIGPKQSIVVFTSTNEEIPKNEKEEVERHRIIGEYLEVVRGFVNIDILRMIDFDNRCHSCNSDLSQLTQMEDELTFCPECNVEVKIPPKSRPTESEDPDNSRSHRNDNYDDRPNFVKAINCYQGKQKNRPSPHIYDLIDKYFIEQGLSYLTGEQVRIHGTDNILDKRRLIFKALRKIEYSGQYENVNLILNIHWGCSLPNISHLEEIILDDYDKSQAIYLQIKGNRKSSLNTQFRLFCHLRNRGWKCSARDFKIITSRKSVLFHKDIWITICTRLGWDDPVYLDEIKMIT